MKKREFFKIDGDRINRIRKHCPKCGPGMFLADHKNRFSCGKCGYTEFKGGGKPDISKEKPVEKPIENVSKPPKQELKKTPIEQPISEKSPDVDTPKEDKVEISESTNDHVKESAEETHKKEDAGEGEAEKSEEKKSADSSTD
jgi:small subunit ribosomal protein S27Ae